MKITLTFSEPGYIANPYRPELYKLIEIQKISGTKRVRSEKKRRETLESYLRDIGMTFDDYIALEKAAKEPFWKNEKGKIIIPSTSVYACLVNANDEAPSRLRIQNLRSALKISDFVTEKDKPDGIWSRFVVLKSGAQKLSNQRLLAESHYIKNFNAIGTIEHDKEMVEEKAIIDLLIFAGRQVGIGSARKMNYGRFAVKSSEKM